MQGSAAGQNAVLPETGGDRSPVPECAGRCGHQVSSSSSLCYSLLRRTLPKPPTVDYLQETIAAAVPAHSVHLGCSYFGIFGFYPNMGGLCNYDVDKFYLLNKVIVWLASILYSSSLFNQPTWCPSKTVTDALRGNGISK